MRTNEFLIRLTEIVIIGVDNFLRSLEHFRSLFELLNKQMADTKVDEC